MKLEGVFNAKARRRGDGQESNRPQKGAKKQRVYDIIMVGRIIEEGITSTIRIKIENLQLATCNL